MAVLRSATYTYKMCDDGYEKDNITYTRWILRMIVNVTSENSTDVAGTVEVHFIRDTNAPAGGYKFGSQNYFWFGINGKKVYESQNLGLIEIPGGTYYDHTLWSGTWTGKKDSSGSFSQKFTAIFDQKQRSDPWSGTVEGTFTITPDSNLYIFVNNQWHLGIPYVYTSAGWKKSSGKTSVYAGGWKS